MIVVFAHHITARLDYAVSLLATAWNCAYTIVNDPEVYHNATGCISINYSDSLIKVTELWIVPQGLLFETTITAQSISLTQWEELPAFFPTTGGIGFDLLAASFYLVSRYEEYLPYEKDMYGRYAHTNSLAFNSGFLHLPLVNCWMEQLKVQAIQLFPSVQLADNRCRFIPTYDIDIAYSYKGKDLRRKVGGLLQSFIKLQLRQALQRMGVLLNMHRDPFDNYDWLDALHEQHGPEAIYFFLLAEKVKEYDRNLSPGTPLMQSLIRRHAKRYITGIHPSWQSYLDPRLVAAEKATLEQLTDQAVTKSRQHYIRLTLPDSYRLLEKLNIQEDYSMGYGSINGFRASFCLPFRWFDLEQNRRSPLTIYPFCYMDANSFFEQRQTPEEAAEEIRTYYQIVQQVNGVFITIFHNNFITAEPPFTGYRRLYADFLAMAGHHPLS
jgi:hypothetical protein